MPTYAYACQCGHTYEEFRFLYEEGPTRCPACKKKKGFGQVYHGGRQVADVRGEPKTFGQQAEINAKRWGPEGIQAEIEKEKRKRKQPSDRPLPEGMKFAEKPKLDPADKPLDLKKIKDVNKYIMTGEM